jgi:hypothetical protein
MFCRWLHDVRHHTSCKNHNVKKTLVQNLIQPLHLVQQHIALFHHCFVLRVLETWAGGLDDAVHFVNGEV